MPSIMVGSGRGGNKAKRLCAAYGGELPEAEQHQHHGQRALSGFLPGPRSGDFRVDVLHLLGSGLQFLVDLADEAIGAGHTGSGSSEPACRFRIPGSGNLCG